MGIFDAIGPIILIIIIYVVYTAFTNLETAQKEKETSIEISKIEAETERDKVKLQREQAFLEYNKKYGDGQPKIRDTDVDYEVLEDKRKRRDN